eukprot:2219980-Alexandrium_andersonii.AAC.1
MSASLVGSEMCIRDRAWVTSPAAPRSRPKFGRPHTDNSKRTGVSSACLLYTSDAADDSSV